MRFLLDEDLSPRIAAIARGLGLDACSVHELGRTGRSDEEQLTFAAGKKRILVTRNRDDFLVLTHTFYATGRDHYGVLIVPRSLSNTKPEAVAHALKQWSDRFGAPGPGMGFADFLPSP